MLSMSTSLPLFCWFGDGAWGGGGGGGGGGRGGGGGGGGQRGHSTRVSTDGRITSCETLTRGGRLTAKTMAAATSSGCIAPSFSPWFLVNSRTFSSLMCSWTSVAVAPGSMMQTRVP